jgi:hypothetical protein
LLNKKSHFIVLDGLYAFVLSEKILIPWFFFNLDIKKDMLFGIGKILNIAILLILEHNKFGIMWVTIMSID